MSEFIRPFDQEQILHSELWNGHDPQDSCPVNTWAHNEPHLTWRAKRHLSEIAKRELKEFLSNRHAYPLTEFREGATFDSAHYPTGTIVRALGFRGAYFHRNKQAIEFPFLDLGVVCERESKNIPIEKAIIIFHNPTNQSAVDFYPSSIEINSTRHTKKVFWGDPLFDDFYKISKIEVLKIGKDRGGKKKKRRFFAPPTLLNPGTEYNI